MFINTVDPDVLTGYNILSFDFWYLIKRAEFLHIPQWAVLGRLLNDMSEVHKTKRKNKAAKPLRIEGRVVLDMMKEIQQTYTGHQRPPSYGLNDVGKHILNSEKEDVPYAMIETLQKGDDISRVQLAIYCLKDAYLPLMMLDKLLIKGWDKPPSERLGSRLHEAFERQQLDRPKNSYYTC